MSRAALRLTALLLERGADTAATSLTRLETTRERLQQHVFAVYFSEQRLRKSWALLQRRKEP